MVAVPNLKDKENLKDQIEILEEQLNSKYRSHAYNKFYVMIFFLGRHKHDNIQWILIIKKNMIFLGRLGVASPILWFRISMEVTHTNLCVLIGVSRQNICMFFNFV